MTQEAGLWWLAWLATAINLGVAIHGARMARRWRRLNRLWIELCLGAWRLRDQPDALAVVDRAGVMLRLRKAIEAIERRR